MAEREGRLEPADFYPLDKCSTLWRVKAIFKFRFKLSVYGRNLKISQVQSYFMIHKGGSVEKWLWVPGCLQSNQVKRTPQDSVNELIIWKMNPLVVPVTGVKFKVAFLHA